MGKIKVLWFSNTPAAGDEYVSSNSSGGWLKSLDKAIQDKIELHVVFHDKGYPSEFKVGETNYYCVAAKSIKQKVYGKIRMFFGKKHPEIDRCLGVVNKVKPDIIHIHGTEAIWIQIAEYIHEIPVILSIQAIVTVMVSKYYSGIQKSEIPCFSYYKKLADYYNKRASDERKYVKYVNYLLGRTTWDKQVYSVIAPHAQYFVSNEVLRDGFYNTNWQEPKRNKDKLIVHTTTGTLLFKGLETVCQALSILNDIGVDVEWRVAGVEEGSEYHRIIKRKLKNDYPQKGLVLLGPLNENDLINRMLEAHIYVSPSHQDNSPNALCEATLLGMPCVSTCAGGSSTIIKDGITGIIVQDGDPWALAGAIMELAKDRILAIRYSSEARKEAIVRHNKKAIVDNLVGIYEKILVKEKK
jgi:glycosyltransferase involved in cell wall biosynthesis